MQQLAATLEVEWTFQVYYYSTCESYPTVEVMLRMPWPSKPEALDDVVLRAFTESRVPGYAHDGDGTHALPMPDGVRLRNITFAEI